VDLADDVNPESTHVDKAEWWMMDLMESVGYFDMNEFETDSRKKTSKTGKTQVSK